MPYSTGGALRKISICSSSSPLRRRQARCRSNREASSPLASVTICRSVPPMANSVTNFSRRTRSAAVRTAAPSAAAGIAAARRHDDDPNAGVAAAARGRIDFAISRSDTARPAM